MQPNRQHDQADYYIFVPPGLTAEKFILEPKDTRTGERIDSLYTKFRLLMSKKLGYPSINNVEIITLLDKDGYLEVRYAAHASPYLSPAQVDNAIILNMAEVNFS